MRRGRTFGRRGVLLVWALLALAGCSSEVTTPGEALRIVGSGLAPAFVGIAYEEPIHAVGGLRPYDFSIVDGVLPAGLSLEGGTVRGVPSDTGSATFTVQVSDANLSKTVQRFSLEVTEIPPPTLTLSAPLTEVQRRVTLRAQLQGARELEGVSTRVGWDPALFRLVEGSVRASRSSTTLLFQAGEGELQVDLVPLGTVLNGDLEIFRLELEPVAEPNFLQLDLSTVFTSVARRSFASGSEGRAAEIADTGEGAPAAAPSDGSPAAPEAPGEPAEPPSAPPEDDPSDAPGAPGEPAAPPDDAPSGRNGGA